MATNNYYTFKCTENEAEKKEKNTKKKKFFFGAITGIVAAGVGVVLYKKGFVKGLDTAEKIVLEGAAEDFSIGVIAGMAKAKFDDGVFDDDAVKNFLSACRDEYVKEGFVLPDTLTDEELKAYAEIILTR
jgi:hypothetical protein